MEQLRQAYASIASSIEQQDEGTSPTSSSSTTLLNIVVATSHRRSHASPGIVDVGACETVGEFYKAVCSRNREHTLLRDILSALRPAENNVEEAQLTSHLLLMLSLPDRIAPLQEKMAAIVDHDRRQAYLAGVAVLIAQRSVVDDDATMHELWSFFSRLCCRRGHSDIVLVAMDDPSLMPFQEVLLLGLCQALGDAPSKLAVIVHKLLVSRSDPGLVLQCALGHHASLCAPENANSALFHRVRVLQRVLFGIVVPQCEFPLSRYTVRRCIKGALFEGSVGGKTPPCERCVVENRKLCINRVASSWNNVAFHLQDVRNSEATGHALSYCLLCCQGNARDLISGDVLSNVLQGISKRFDLLRHPSLREEAARIAMMYAEGYVASSDALPTFDEFPDALSKWLEAESTSADEVLLAKRSLPLQSAREPTKDAFAIETFSCGTSVYPVDADESIELLVIAHSTNQCTPAVDKTAILMASDSHVVQFGHRDFKGSVGPPCTLRQVYELLCVTPPNQSEAQQKEDALKALQQISAVLDAAGSQDIVLNRSDSTLLPKVLHAIIHCDAEAALRRNAISCCIVASPLQCLASIGDSFSSNALSFIQQADVWSCIQDAATRLATLASSPLVPAPHTRDELRLYPPCRQRTPAGPAAASASGRVRWKSRRLSQRPATTHNVLVDVAAAFLDLAIASKRTNKMLPFVDLAVLRCLDTIMKLISPARHVAPLWAVRVVRFALQFTIVDSGETRSQAWALMWTAVESCSPSMHDSLWNETLALLLSAAVDSDPLVRPLQLRTIATILQDTDQ